MQFGKRLSVTTLYNFIKSHKQYVYNRDIPHATCLCEICENVVLLAKGLNKRVTPKLPVNPHDIVEKFSCCASAVCMQGTCIVCSTIEDCVPSPSPPSLESDEDSESDNDGGQ